MTSGLAARLAHTDPRLLLPAATTGPPDHLELVVAVRLPASGPALYLVLATEASGWAHLVPAVVDATGLRRARAGDGFAVAVLDLLSAGRVGPAYHVRTGSAVSVPLGDTTEAHVTDGPELEMFSVGEHRVGLRLEPFGRATEFPDVVGALDRSGYAGMLPWVGDVVLAGAGQVFGPVASGTIRPAAARSVSDQLLALVAGHLRGGDEAEPTLDLAARLGAALAGLHVGLSRVQSTVPPGRTATADEVSSWRREASDAVAEAVVLAEGEPGERLRSRRGEVRAALDALSEAEGTPLLQALPVLGPGSFVMVGEDLLVDPLETGSSLDPWRSPVRDVAATVRGVDHIARSVHRRLVAGGFPAPIERVGTWYEAVREALLASYRATLAAEGASGLFDERLLLAFEVAAECRALTRASRYLSMTRGIADAALADLLTGADRG